jgi:hypothetical protein
MNYIAKRLWESSHDSNHLTHVHATRGALGRSSSVMQRSTGTACDGRCLLRTGLILFFRHVFDIFVGQEEYTSAYQLSKVGQVFTKVVPRILLVQSLGGPWQPCKKYPPSRTSFRGDFEIHTCFNMNWFFSQFVFL